MARQSGAIVIKKYANRRLYNTDTSTYVTLEDLAVMVKNGVDFQVFDARSEAEITNVVLTQILLEQESQPGNGILPIEFLRKMICLYEQQDEDSRSDVLDRSLSGITDQPIRIYSKMRKSFGDAPLSINLPLNNSRNADGFSRHPEAGEIDELRSQLQQLQTKLEKFS